MRIRSPIAALGIGAATLLLAAMLASPEARACPNRHRRDEPLCLAVQDGNQSLLTLRLERHGMLDADDPSVRVVRATANGLEPMLGAAYQTGPHAVVVNLQGTVAGFFTALHFTFDPDAGSGTGRLVGELSAHATTTLAETPCQ